MPEEITKQITGLSEMEYKLIINSLKVCRGDYGKIKTTQMWAAEIDELLQKLEAK